MLAQIDHASRALDSYQANYGPYAFGTVSVLVLMTTAAVLWAKLIAPRQQDIANAQTKAAEELTKTTENLRSTAQTQSMMQTSMQQTAMVQAEQARHLGIMLEKLHKDS